MNLTTSRRSFFTTRLTLATGFIACSLATTSMVRAQNYNEVGDAGQTPGTAQNSGLTTVSANAQSITGNLSSVNDADVFRITITSIGTFFASTVNSLTGTSGGPGGLDTQLFLFDSMFRPVMANNDAPGGASLQSLLSPGSIFVNGLAPGTYYLGISLSGNDPVNLANQLVFGNGGGDPTALRGPAAGINPNSFSDFDGFASSGPFGAYQITFGVPDTGSTIVLTACAIGALAIFRRFRAGSAV